MIAISPKLTLFAFLPLPMASIVIQYFGRRIHERFERIQAMFSDISARAQENFSGARVIRAYVQEQAEIAAFENANQEYIRRSLRSGPPDGHALADARTDARRRRRHRLCGSAAAEVLARAKHERRRFRRLQYLHGAAHLASDRARLGHQHLPARNRVAGAYRRNSVQQPEIADENMGIKRDRAIG